MTYQDPGSIAAGFAGSVQAAHERADKAEAKLKRIRQYCRPGKHYVKYQGRIESIADVVVRIIDEDT